jgi:hypothetical protein
MESIQKVLDAYKASADCDTELAAAAQAELDELDEEEDEDGE